MPFRPVNSNSGNSTDIKKGLTNALISNLSEIQELRVTPAKDIQSLFADEFDPISVGQEFGSDTVLSGSFRTEGNDLKIDAKHYSNIERKIIWTESFTIKGKRQIDRENEAALRIARKINIRVAGLRDIEAANRRKLNGRVRDDFFDCPGDPRDCGT